ncbi:PREDICTED: uncharacterized protein LOC105360382 [Ceratosolen solmsi marchali]|uniref:Uncharacterized protein LOC105360382 n=1 Tax=Ceratosolen solmsi marchali TaxID=326594 RepID=A0AAJ6VP07_9HYME|nr:PREDICTED: uncharacterized protein LOC105360382 [Ceratosolen solmsi marchali]
MVSRIHVLTAAHCLKNRQVNNTAVLYGTNTLIYGVTYNIRWWIYFNEWALYRNKPLPFIENDIAILKLTHQIVGHFQPALLLQTTEVEMIGYPVFLAGWGTSDRRVLSLNLLTDVAVVVSNAQCEAHILRGDFGGPVLHCGRLVGINKQVLPKGTSVETIQKINVHMNTSYYSEFITDVTNDDFVWHGIRQIFTSCRTQCNFPTVNALIGSEVRSAQSGDFSFLAAFRHVNLLDPHPTRNHICTGSLITRSHVLSAAQCIENRSPNETVVIHGSNLLDYCAEYNIEWWITYTEWALYRNMFLDIVDHDVSVTKLTHPIEEQFQVGRLAPISITDAVDKFVRMAGWGISNQRQISRAILLGSARVLFNDDCERRIFDASGRAVMIGESHFCTHNSPFTLLKRGDFGGPVLYYNRIIGINKEVLPDLVNRYNPEKVNVHSNIHYYREFILYVSNENFAWL